MERLSAARHLTQKGAPKIEEMNVTRRIPQEEELQLRPEPPGRARRKSGRARIFVVQKHDASRLQYDFRLEIRGVLAWAVPKGPSLNPAVKGLAIRTEDHPIEYANFEGIIPEGQYGAGPVMIWDRGTYEPEDGLSPEQQLAGGEIKVVLNGAKLRGGFVLLYPGRSIGEPGEKTRWLLIKRRDEMLIHRGRLMTLNSTAQS